MIGRQSGRSSGSSSGMRWSSQSYAGHRSSSGTQSSRASFLRRSADTAVRSPLTAPQTTRRQRESVRGSILHFIPNMPDEMFESSELSMTVEQQTKTIGMSREGSLEDEVSEKPTEDNEEILDAGEMDECVAGDGAVAAAVANDAVPDDAECAEGTNEQESGDDHEYGEHVKADDER
uniref:Uncharacterized protein n=1 Tax=Craspedostauros australis TaxID=1486917 RepID=A0A7R9ZQF4_9STRA